MPTITAAVWNGGDSLQLERLRLADPGPGQVRVRMAAAGVCHSDLHIVKGEWARRHPQVLGHEGSGIVEEVGSGVESLEVGDHVVLSWTPYCGVCPQCTRVAGGTQGGDHPVEDVGRQGVALLLPVEVQAQDAVGACHSKVAHEPGH